MKNVLLDNQSKWQAFYTTCTVYSLVGTYMSRYFTYYIFSLVGILHDIYFTWRIVYFMRSFTRHIFSLIDILHNIYFLSVFIYFTWHIQYFTNGIGRCERFSKLLPWNSVVAGSGWFRDVKRFGFLNLWRETPYTLCFCTDTMLGNTILYSHHLFVHKCKECTVTVLYGVIGMGEYNVRKVLADFAGFNWWRYCIALPTVYVT